MFEGVADVAWMDSGACSRLEDGSIMFPAGTPSPLARQTCAGCPVLDRCRDWIDQVEGCLDRTKIGGFIAGESVKQRVRRRLQEAVPA